LIVLLEFGGFASLVPGLVNSFVLGRVGTGAERGRASGMHLVKLGLEYAHRAADTTRDLRQSFPPEEGHDHQELDAGVRAFEETLRPMGKHLSWRRPKTYPVQ
jgi:hypothetical protein